MSVKHGPRKPLPNATPLQCYLDVTSAAAALLKREAALASSSSGTAAAAASAAASGSDLHHQQQDSQHPPPPLPPGSFEGWHVAGGAEGADGAAAWWGRGAGVWSGDDRLLAAGARVVAGLREAVERRLGFTCSAGECLVLQHPCRPLAAAARAAAAAAASIPTSFDAHNLCLALAQRPHPLPATPSPHTHAGIAHYKVLAKLASGLHKPRQQTVVPSSR